MSDKLPLPGPEEVFADIESLRTQMTLADAAEISRRGTRERCTRHPYSWHFPEVVSCEEFTENLIGGDGFSELLEHPDTYVQTAGKAFKHRMGQQKEQLRKAVTTNGELHKHMKQWRLLAIAMTGLSAFQLGQDLGSRLGWW